jgi:hypothetical protein
VFAEADRLLALLKEHEAAADTVRRCVDYTRERESEIAGIEADAVVGLITEEEAEARKAELISERVEAEERNERHERLLAELRRRTADAGKTVTDEHVRRARVPVEETAHALREAEKIVELRSAEHAAARESYEEAKDQADTALAMYDRDHAVHRLARHAEHERKIAWALGQPRIAVQQLPLAWQAEAYERYDARQAEAAEWRKGAEQRRAEALVNPKDALGSEVRL